MRAVPRAFSAAVLLAALVASNGAEAQIIGCELVPKFEGPGDLNYDICVGQGNLPVGEASDHTGLTFAGPRLPGPSGRFVTLPPVFDAGLLPSPAPGEGFKIFVFGDATAEDVRDEHDRMRGEDPNYRELAQTYGPYGMADTALAMAFAFAPLRTRDDMSAVVITTRALAQQRLREARQRFQQTSEYRRLKAVLDDAYDEWQTWLKDSIRNLGESIALSREESLARARRLPPDTYREQRTSLDRRREELDRQEEDIGKRVLAAGRRIEAAFEAFAPDERKLMDEATALTLKYLTDNSLLSNDEPLEIEEEGSDSPPLGQAVDDIDQEDVEDSGRRENVIDEIEFVIVLS